MRKKIVFFISPVFLSLLVLSLSACSWVKPYRADVQQGNVVEQKETKLLQTGMRKNEVQDLLGTPVLASSFDGNHWTYAYTNQINGGKIERKVVDLYFNGDKLVKVESKLS